MAAPSNRFLGCVEVIVTSGTSRGETKTDFHVSFTNALRMLPLCSIYHSAVRGNISRMLRHCSMYHPALQLCFTHVLTLLDLPGHLHICMHACTRTYFDACSECGVVLFLTGRRTNVQRHKRSGATEPNGNQSRMATQCWQSSQRRKTHASRRNGKHRRKEGKTEQNGHAVLATVTSGRKHTGATAMAGIKRRKPKQNGTATRCQQHWPTEENARSPPQWL